MIYILTLWSPWFYLIKCHGKSQKCTGWTWPFYPFMLFTSALFGTKCPREGGTLNQFQYFDNHKGYVNEFRFFSMLIRFFWSNISLMLDSYLGVKSICFFQQTFSCKKIKGNIVKWQKKSTLKHFSLPRYSKHRLHNKIMPPPHSTSSLEVTWKTNKFSKFWLALYKEWFILVKVSMVKGFSCTLLYITVHIFELSLEC